MLTQCPNCQTTFRVKTEILRVADGQVRCGRCQTQFDALDGMVADEVRNRLTTAVTRLVTKKRTSFFTSQPDSRKETASQSSNSGWLGG